MFKTFNIWLFFAVVITIPVSVYAVVNWYEQSVRALPVLVDKNHTIDDYQLTNQQGKQVSTAEWKNKIVVANFFFTYCPSICPKMTKNLITAQQVYINKNDLLLVSFSVDPERDSVKRLAEYADKFSINETKWQLLTGSKKEIYRLARKSFKVTATDGDGGANDFIHSNKLILIDTKKRIRGYYDGTDEKETTQLIKDIKKLENEL
jgi:protein SCO1/2